MHLHMIQAKQSVSNIALGAVIAFTKTFECTNSNLCIFLFSLVRLPLALATDLRADQSEIFNTFPGQSRSVSRLIGMVSAVCWGCSPIPYTNRLARHGNLDTITAPTNNNVRCFAVPSAPSPRQQSSSCPRCAAQAPLGPWG